MNKNILIGIVIVVVAVASYSLGASRSVKSDTTSAQNPGRQRGIGMNRGGGDAFVNGDVLSHDDMSVTIKLKDGGSKIVFISASSTKIMKTTQGSLVDLSEGSKVTINGTTNTDGSVTANSIQLRKDN
jgi:hypothetical protein